MLVFLPLWKYRSLLFSICSIVIRTQREIYPLNFYVYDTLVLTIDTIWPSRFSSAYSSFLRSNFGLVCESSSWHELKCHLGFHWTHVISYIKVLWPRNCSPLYTLNKNTDLFSLRSHQGRLVLATNVLRFYQLTVLPFAIIFILTELLITACYKVVYQNHFNTHIWGKDIFKGNYMHISGFTQIHLTYSESQTNLNWSFFPLYSGGDFSRRRLLGGDVTYKTSLLKGKGRPTGKDPAVPTRGLCCLLFLCSKCYLTLVDCFLKKLNTVGFETFFIRLKCSSKRGEKPLKLWSNPTNSGPCPTSWPWDCKIRLCISSLACSHVRPSSSWVWSFCD